MKKNHATNPSQGVIYTLAQSETTAIGNTATIVNGLGSDLSKTKALKGRAKRKVITQKMVVSLIDAVEKKGSTTEMKKSYWNTFHCQNKLITANGRLYTRYCKNRHCTLCNSIRKAEIINRYLPFIRTWPQPHHVVLTIKSVPYYNLRFRLAGLIRGFKKINAKYRKGNQRKGGFRLIGIRSLECNYNPISKTYNPHFHLIVPDEKTADILISEWLKLCTIKFASPLAQKKYKIFNNEKALLEVLKYGSKIFTEPDVKDKSQKGDREIHSAALHIIFSAMKGLRIFDRFGFNLPKQEKPKISAALISQYNEWTFEAKDFDWINESGKSLSNYVPEPALIDLLENRIEINLE